VIIAKIYQYASKRVTIHHNNLFINIDLTGRVRYFTLQIVWARRNLLYATPILGPVFYGHYPPSGNQILLFTPGSGSAAGKGA
jgi:hypothetical protein